MQDEVQLQLLWLQLEQQEHQISVAVSQAELLRQQVAIETQCRNDAEASYFIIIITIFLPFNDEEICLLSCHHCKVYKNIVFVVIVAIVIRYTEKTTEFKINAAIFYKTVLAELM